MNQWFAAAPAGDNPCETGASRIAFQGQVHNVSYTTPEGGLKMNIRAT